MRNINGLNERDLNVLNALWAADRPLTTTDILRAAPDTTQSTVIAVTRKLLDDGLVEVQGTAYSRTVHARTYVPTEASKNAVVSTLAYQYGLMRDIISVPEACRILMDVETNPKDRAYSIKQLRAILDDLERGDS